jgi:hypothetical protein
MRRVWGSDLRGSEYSTNQNDSNTLSLIPKYAACSEVTEQINSCKCPGCSMSTHEMQLGLQENIQIYNELNGIIKDIF